MMCGLCTCIVIIPIPMAIVCKSAFWGRSIVRIAGLDLPLSTNVRLLCLCVVKVAACAEAVHWFRTVLLGMCVSVSE